MDKKEKKTNKEQPVTVHITNHNQFQKGVGAFITNLNHLTLVMDAEGNMKMDMGQIPVMPHTETDIKQDHQDPDTAEKNDTDKIAKCFNFPNEFTKQQVTAVVKAFYQGEHADLALIEVALYDHGLLKKRNAHTAFIHALMAWRLINPDKEGLKQLISGIKDKYKRLPNDGYLSWDKEYLNDKTICQNIGKKLGPTMKYQR